MKETRAYVWVKSGRLPRTPKGCGKWNVYRSRGEERPSVIDVKCKFCGERVKFQPRRQDNRGQPTPASWLERPAHMPLRAMIDEMQARNRREALNAEIEGFQKASDLSKGGV